MRITFVLPSPTLNGGMRVAAIYARRLMDRGHHVAIVFHSYRNVRLRAQVRSLLKGRGWPPLRPNGLDFFRNLGVPTISVPPTGNLDDVPDADVVIATWWRTAEMVAALDDRKGAKVYFLQHFEAHPALPLERVRDTWRLPMHKVVVHRWLADLARDEFNDPHASIVPNSVDTDLFDGPPRGRQPIPTVGMMYSEAHFKGCDIAYRAVEIARARMPALRLMAFGVTVPFQRISIPPNTEFFRQPAQATIRDIYARCDAWLFPSRNEGFGLPILEAMACRTPVIGTPAGAAPDLLSDGCGILVRNEDPEDMARGIERMIAMPEAEWRKMSDAAYARARAYTWEHATDLFEQALYRASHPRTDLPRVLAR